MKNVEFDIYRVFPMFNKLINCLDLKRMQRCNGSVRFDWKACNVFSREKDPN